MVMVYRLQQGFRALAAFSQPVDWNLAGQYLPTSLLAVFQQMNRGEQLHSLAVLRDVLAQGDMPSDLAVAALLHDVGKSRYPINVFQKTMVVVAHKFLPSVYYQLSNGSPLNLWQRPFVVYAQHPAWSAEMVAAAGASEAASWLVAHHADGLEDWRNHPLVGLLARLKQADDQN